MKPGLLGPPFGDEAVAAGASDSLLLGWGADRGGGETRIDVEGHLNDEEESSAPKPRTAICAMSRSTLSIAAQASLPTLGFAGGARSAD
jgi:hypothetical protein